MSDGKVVDIATRAPVTDAKNAEPKPEAIAYCERLLDMAKSGKLRWIATACLADDGFFATGWLPTEEGITAGAAGAIAMLQHEFMADWSASTDG